MTKHRDRVVVITGASGGIGEASALEFAKRGARLALVSRGRERLARVEKKLSGLGADALAVQCDVSKRSDVERMSGLVLERFGRVDVLVNNAGFAVYGPVKDLAIRDIESQMATNYFGMIYCTKSFLPVLLEQDSGHIVNVASVAGSVGLPNIASYCASKFAMLGFSEGLKHELADTGVGVTVVSPIMVRTGFFDNPSFARMPRSRTASISAARVASAVLRAADSSRLEIVVPGAVRGAIWARQTFPYVIDPIIRSSFRRQFAPRPADSADRS